MSKRRQFTAEFKSQVVLQLLSREKSMAELCREHQFTSQMPAQLLHPRTCSGRLYGWMSTDC